MYNKEIVKKFLQCFTCIIVLIVVEFIIKLTYVDAKSSSNELPYNVDQLHLHYTNKFFNYISINEYENAYMMLSEECKAEEFENNIENFKKIVDSLNLKEDTEIFFKNKNKYTEKKYNLYADMVYIGKKEILVNVYEYDLHTYELSLSVIDGEGL